LEEVGGAVEFYRGAAPLELPHTLSRPSTLLRATLSLSKGRAPLRRRAPFAWLARLRLQENFSDVSKRLIVNGL